MRQRTPPGKVSRALFDVRRALSFALRTGYHIEGCMTGCMIVAIKCHLLGCLSIASERKELSYLIRMIRGGLT